MDIKIVVRVPGAEERTTTREEFWQELRNRRGISPEGDQAKRDSEADEAERRIHSGLPAKLSGDIRGYIAQHSRIWRTAFNRFRRPLRRRSVLDEGFLISVKSIRYGSLEILLNFLADDDFPLRATDVVQLLAKYAPQHLSTIMGAASLGVSVGEPIGSLRGEPGIVEDQDDQAALTRRAFYLANFSLLVLVVLSLAACYVVFQAATAQMNATRDERGDLLGQAAKINADRGQLVKDALELVQESRAGTAELQRYMKKELESKPKAAGAGHENGPRGEGTPGTKVLTTPNFTIFGSGPNLNLGELAKEVVDVSVKTGEAGVARVRELIQGIGDGLDVAKKGVGVTSDVVDLVRKILPQTKDETGKTEKTEKTETMTIEKIEKTEKTEKTENLPEGILLDEKVSFGYDSDKLDEKMEKALGQVVKKLHEHPTAVLIEGHTDAAGSDSYNKDLSQRRAEAVKRFLIDNNVPEKWLETHGYGKGYLWLHHAPKDAANRRVRIIMCTVAGENRCKSAVAAPPPAEAHTR